MNDVYKTDPDGSLYDPQARAAMMLFVGQGDTLAMEAAAAVRSASHAVERMRAHGSEGRGLSSGAMDLLLRLGAAGDGRMSIKELARSGGVSSRNVTGLVDTLERDGLVSRVPDGRDRRSVLAVITDDGREWIRAFGEPTQRAMAALFRGFSPAEVTGLRTLCLRLAENQRQLADFLSRGETPE
jgi:DNA-binding MarR family transcriptional regulator